MKTVSRVVNNERWVSPDVENRVRDAIESLGYRPDHRAQRLRMAATTTSTIGIVHADLANPFFTGVHSGVEEIASEHDLLILTGSSGESVARQEALIGAFTERRVDGLVVVPAGTTSCDADSSPSLSAELRRGTPIVFIDRESGFKGDLVASDHFGGASLATRHLLDGGHRSIAFIGDRQHLSSAIERHRGFSDEVAKCGTCMPTVVIDIDTAEAAQAAVVALLTAPEPPTAVFAAQNHLTTGAVRALHALGLQRDVALVGFDDVTMGDVIQPGVTVVPQDAAALGREAGRLLIDRMKTRGVESTRRILPVSLVARGSGEIPGPFL